MSGLLSTMIYCVTTHFPLFVVVPLLSFFFIMKKYICPKRSSVIYLSCYHVSISPLQAVLHSLSCKNLLVSVKSLSQMFMSHIRKCMFRLCVYLLGIYQSFYVQKCFLVCLQLIITDQRDFLNGFTKHYKSCNTAVMKCKRKKRAICFSF